MGNTFSRNLKIARINAGFTQEYVASHIGVATSTYSLYENGKREPNIGKIKMLADLHAPIVSTGHGFCANCISVHIYLCKLC